ncbi:hypothetical protein J4464_01490 [Candidatus Woesearchaeota archaeon]|nr:hypothetical protein [Candidatus Woesearchaeota archaeon]
MRISAFVLLGIAVLMLAACNAQKTGEAAIITQQGAVLASGGYVEWQDAKLRIQGDSLGWRFQDLSSGKESATLTRNGALKIYGSDLSFARYGLNEKSSITMDSSGGLVIRPAAETVTIPGTIILQNRKSPGIYGKFYTDDLGIVTLSSPTDKTQIIGGLDVKGPITQYGQPIGGGSGLTKQDVLNMLAQCDMYSMDTLCSYQNGKIVCRSDSIFGVIPQDSNGLTTAGQLCAKIQKTCIAALTRWGDNGRQFTELSACKLKTDPSVLRFTCCTA